MVYHVTTGDSGWLPLLGPSLENHLKDWSTRLTPDSMGWVVGRTVRTANILRYILCTYNKVYRTPR